MSETNHNSAPDPDTNGGSPWIRRFLVWILPLAVMAGAVFIYGSAGRYVDTDNAYLHQDRVDVGARIAGVVTQVYVAENEHVTLNQPLIKLSDLTFVNDVQAAEAHLSSARTDIGALKATYFEKQGEVEVAKRAAEFARRDVARQREMAKEKLISAQALDTAERSATLAEGTIGVLQLQLVQAAARLGGNPNLSVDQYPLVRAALAELERAKSEVFFSLIVAPQSGIASHLPKVGARVEVGTPACAILSDKGFWIDANYKETDLEWVRVGQPVEIEIDTYSQRRWYGRVESISQATGAAFSLLPPQNATGNWVKVVQRIPVRVAITLRADDPPLRDGMSSTVTIDTGPHTRFDRWFGRRE
jgi:membrane fusion protein (multidrug efflux system)